MRDINISELRTLLKFEGVSLDDFSDEEIEVLIKAKISELEGLIGLNIVPKDRTQITKRFFGEVYELDFYPVIRIYKIFVNDKLISHDDYNFNRKLGLIYFSPLIEKGNVRVLYTSGVTDNDFDNLIIPLIKDMIGFTIGYGKANTTLNGLGGFLNSMHEGDVSLSFGTMSKSSGGVGDYGYNSGINTKIDDLRKRYMYSGRVKYF